MPLLTNFVAHADVLKKAESLEAFIESTFSTTPANGPFDFESVADTLFTHYQQDLLSGNGDDFFEKMDWLEGYAWEHQAEEDPNKKWLPGNGDPDGMLFVEYMGQHYLVAEEERESASEIPSLHDAVELIGELEGYCLREQNRDAAHKIPEFFHLLRCCREFYSQMQF